MDRSSRRNGFVWAWVASGALLLPACSDVGSPERDGQAPRISSAVVPAHRTGTVAYRSGSENADSGHVAVVLASHKFNPPPLPQVAAGRDPSSRAHLPTRDPDTSTVSAQVPRRLPEIDTRSAHQIDLQIGETPAASAPELELPPPPQPDAEHGLTEALIRRLPSVDSDATTVNDVIRRLPSVDQESVDQSPSALPELEGPALTSPLQSAPLQSAPLQSTLPDVGAAESESRGVTVAEQPPHHMSGGPWYVPDAPAVATKETKGVVTETVVESTDSSTQLFPAASQSKQFPEPAPLLPSMADAFPPATTYELPYRVVEEVELPLTERQDTAGQVELPNSTDSTADALPGDGVMVFEDSVAEDSVAEDILDAPLAGQATLVPQPAQVWTPVSVPVASKQAAEPLVESQRDATMEVIARRVMEHSRKAEDLASRGAYYAARAEMIKALRAVTQSLDAQQGSKRHSEALARAMRVFQEAGDFAPRGSQLEADLNLTQIVSGHRTTVLKDVNLDHLTPLVAQQKYLEYAQEQFAEACDDLPAASYALYGLARIYSVMDHAKLGAQMLCLPKAVTLHQAALLVDPSNAKAANELGVLLARFGQFEDARRVLQHALSICPEPEIWMNVAAVHQRLGESALARQAHQQGTLMASRQAGGTRLDAAPVKWVDPKTFSAVRPGPGQ